MPSRHFFIVHPRFRFFLVFSVVILRSPPFSANLRTELRTETVGTWRLSGNGNANAARSISRKSASRATANRPRLTQDLKPTFGRRMRSGICGSLPLPGELPDDDRPLDDAVRLYLRHLTASRLKPASKSMYAQCAGRILAAFPERTLKTRHAPRHGGLPRQAASKGGTGYGAARFVCIRTSPTLPGWSP